MHVIAHHRISDPDGFRRRAEEPAPGRPSHWRLILSAPASDGDTTFCLWWADSAEDLQDFLERSLGDVCRVECHAVDEENAMGLFGPAVTLVRDPHGVRLDGPSGLLLDRRSKP